MQLVQRDADTLDVMDGNNRVAYAEGEVLHGIDAEGYAVRIGSFEQRSEIIGIVTAWRMRLGLSKSLPVTRFGCMSPRR